MSENGTPDDKPDLFVALFDHANVAAGLAEIEASELRVELRQIMESKLSFQVVAHRYLETLIPLMKRLHRFRQISGAEVDHFVACQQEDRRSVEAALKMYRVRYGVNAKSSSGEPLVLPEQKPQSQTQ